MQARCYIARDHIAFDLGPSATKLAQRLAPGAIFDRHYHYGTVDGVEMDGPLLAAAWLLGELDALAIPVSLHTA